MSDPHGEMAAPYSCDSIVARLGCRSWPFSRDSEARTVAFDIEVSDTVSAKGCAVVSAK
jgi:hypothetical protein